MTVKIDEEGVNAVRQFRPLSFVTGAALVALSSACTATGMGFYQSCDGLGNATFGFSWRSSDSHFEGAYHDSGIATAAGVDNAVISCIPTGVKFQGQGSLPPTFVSECGSNTQALDGFISYRSQDPNVPDLPGVDTAPELQMAHLTVCDTGHDTGSGNRAGDFISIRILSGPFAGYRNAGTVIGGNITVHDNGM